MKARVILFYKPYGVLSQFTPEGNWETLASFGPFPKSVYPAGRLDAESEGLLLLTDDNRIKQRVTDPRYGHPRTYVAQVERVPDGSALDRLSHGVAIEGRTTLPAVVRLIPSDPGYPPRPVPIRFRKSVPTAWVEITITEGKNRQVRKMTAAVGHPTLRLVRTSIGTLTLKGLAPGEWRDASREEAEELLATPSRGNASGTPPPGRTYRAPSAATSGSPVSKSKSVSRRRRK